MLDEAARAGACRPTPRRGSSFDRYSHLFGDALDAVTDRLDEARQRTVVLPSCPQDVVVPLAR